MRSITGTFTQGGRHPIVHWVLPAGLTLLGCLTATAAGSQTVLSATTWGGASSDATNGVAAAADGSTYLTGSTRSFGNIDTPIVFLIKFAADGSLTWQRTWDGPSQFFSDEGMGTAVAPDGSVYVAGNTLGSGGDALLLEFAADGALLSQRTWGSPDGDFGKAVAVGPDGAVYLVGQSRISDPGAADAFIVKFAADGTMLWQKTWGTLDSFEEGQGVAVGPDGSVYLASYTVRPNDPFSFDIVLLKIDTATGNLVWARTLGAGDSNDARAGVAVARDGSVYIAGAIFAPRTSDLNAVVAKFMPDGSLVWVRSWGGTSGDDAAGIVVAPNGTVLLCGQTNVGPINDDAFLVRFQPGGRVINSVTWGSTGIDRWSGMGVAPDGAIALGGTVGTGPPYSTAAGSKRAARPMATVAASAIPLVDAAGTVADAGGLVGTPAGSTTYAGDYDAVLVRPVMADAATSVVEEGAKSPYATATALSRQAELTFALPGEERASLPAVVLDVSGRRVRMLAASVGEGVAEVTWDLQDESGDRVPSGLYFVAVEGAVRRVGRIVVYR